MKKKTTVSSLAENNSELRLVCGKVDSLHFELLLEGTSIRAEALIEALREHLVGGLPASDSWSKHGVNMSQFWRRLDVLQVENQRAAKLSVFYPRRANP